MNSPIQMEESILCDTASSNHIPTDPHVDWNGVPSPRHQDGHVDVKIRLHASEIRKIYANDSGGTELETVEGERFDVLNISDKKIFDNLGNAEIMHNSIKIAGIEYSRNEIAHFEWIEPEIILYLFDGSELHYFLNNNKSVIRWLSEKIFPHKLDVSYGNREISFIENIEKDPGRQVVRKWMQVRRAIPFWSICDIHIPFSHQYVDITTTSGRKIRTFGMSLRDYAHIATFILGKLGDSYTEYITIITENIF